MNVAEIKTCDIANGPGVRVSLFVSGCTHHCPGCFNEIAWDFNYGEAFSLSVQQDILAAVDHTYISGLTLLGGEPLEYCNQQGLLPFLEEFRARFPQKTVWCYSGYTLEQIRNDMLPRYKETARLLQCIDVLVDGRFVEEERDITLRFRGSRNQRIINLSESLKSDEVVLWQEY